MTKPTKLHLSPAKIQISLGIRPVMSEFSLCAKWVTKDPNCQADSEDWVFARRTCHIVDFVMLWLNYGYNLAKTCVRVTLTALLSSESSKSLEIVDITNLGVNSLVRKHQLCWSDYATPQVYPRLYCSHIAQFCILSCTEDFVSISLCSIVHIVNRNSWCPCFLGKTQLISIEHQKSCTTKKIVIFRIWKKKKNFFTLYDMKLCFYQLPFSCEKRGNKAINEAWQGKRRKWGHNRKCKRIHQKNSLNKRHEKHYQISDDQCIKLL